MARTIRSYDVPSGSARVVVDRAATPRATLVLTHGAGGGIDARDLLGLAEELPGRGISVMRVEMPWVGQGRKIAPAPSVLDRDWVAVHNQLRSRSNLIVGGRSAGARVACRTARNLGAVGCVALAFPLHPPGKPDKSRASELQESGVRTLVVQGERDTFGKPLEFPFGHDIEVIPAANHEFGVAKKASVSQTDVLTQLVDAVDAWITRLLG